MKHFINAFKRYSDFKGRSSRAEYWYFILFYFIFSIVIGIIGGIIDGVMGSESLVITNLLNIIYTLGTIIPSFAIAVRRMHDINKSGWWILIPLYNLYLAIQKGTPGENQYGPDPLGQAEPNQ